MIGTFIMKDAQYSFEEFSYRTISLELLDLDWHLLVQNQQWNTKAIGGGCSKLTIKKPEQCY